jgi:hypothetical protein
MGLLRALEDWMELTSLVAHVSNKNAVNLLFINWVVFRVKDRMVI